MPTRSIPWPRILAEGVAIVVSILLAFGIQAWWEGVQEREEEQEILSGLTADFEANIAELADNLRRHEVMMDRLLTLFDMSASEAQLVPQESLPPFNLGLINLSTFDSQDATLDAVIASGRLDLIRDRELRGRLVEWKKVVEDSREEAESFRLSGVRVIEHLARMGGPYVVRREGGSGITGMQTLPPIDLATLVDDEGLMALLREKRFMIISYHNALEGIQEVADGMLALIERSRTEQD